jgi:hypothetical protein
MIVNPMEVEEAAVSGLRVISYSDLDYYGAYAQHKDNPGVFQAWLWRQLLQAADVTSGRVGVYGPAGTVGAAGEPAAGPEGSETEAQDG